ncbi:lytic transglycosylase domain-containing protein [Aliiroseovarius sp.]|uniref:lytic transglycosylase domain-containing protein n=1 Tax=Aliiroseovarius sp. TaxID=1872442 RepID=UPI003BAC5C20
MAVLLAAPIPSNADSSHADGDLCIAAANRAAEATDVPNDVLLAISILETARPEVTPLAAWPWTVSVRGERFHFATRNAAAGFMKTSIQNGEVALEAGCFLIDLSRHGAGFPTMLHSLDPETNALYAARLLLELYREKGDWDLAAGVYHSRSVALARDYAARFRILRADVMIADGAATALRQPVSTLASAFSNSAPGTPREIRSLDLASPRSPTLGSLFPTNGITDLSATLPRDE